MKLYSSWSPNPQKVRFALAELEIGADIVDIDLFKGEQRSDAFTALNPMQKVPVIEDNEFSLWESNAILAWLGERERKLWPRDPAGNALALKWMFFEARHISDSAGNLWFYESVAPKIGAPIDQVLTDRGRADLQRPLFVLDRHFEESPWLLGRDFTLVDCSMGADLAALSASKFDWTEYPRARAYVERIRERRGWQATNPRY